MKHFLRFIEGQKLDVNLLMQPIALLGNRSSGKTYGGLKLFEQAHGAGVQCIWIDPVGKAWGLRAGVDGDPKGGLKNVYIFGGKRGDFPLTPDKGAYVAKVLFEKRVSVVLDVSLFRKSERKSFITALLEEFYHLAKLGENSYPRVFFLEEAHLVIPQKPQKGDERMVGAVEDVVLLGRNAGLGVVLMDQRPAHVNKSCLAEVEALFALRMTYPIDRKVIREWISAKGVGEVDLDEELPKLKKGLGYFWVPSEDIFLKAQIRERETYDSSATVRIGEGRRAVVKLGRVAASEIESAMNEVTEAALVNDTKALRAKITQLTAELRALKAQKPKVIVAPAPVKQPKPNLRVLQRVEKAVKQGGKAIERLEGLRSDFEKTKAGLEKIGEAITFWAGAFTGATLELKKTLVPSASPASSSAAEIQRVVSKNAEIKAVNNGWPANMRDMTSDYRVSKPLTEDEIEGGMEEELSDYARHLLRTVVEHLPMKMNRNQLSTISGRSKRSSAFPSALSDLHKRGMLEIVDGCEVPTARGVAEIGTVLAEPASKEETRSLWLSKLPTNESGLLAAGLAIGGAFSRDALAAQAKRSMRSSAFPSGISQLKKNGLFEEAGPQMLRVSAVLA